VLKTIAPPSEDIDITSTRKEEEREQLPTDDDRRQPVVSSTWYCIFGARFSRASRLLALRLQLQNTHTSIVVATLLYDSLQITNIHLLAGKNPGNMYCR